MILTDLFLWHPTFSVSRCFARGAWADDKCRHIEDHVTVYGPRWSYVLLHMLICSCAVTAVNSVH